jgi:hypothetical protein
MSGHELLVRLSEARLAEQPKASLATAAGPAGAGDRRGSAYARLATSTPVRKLKTQMPRIGRMSTMNRIRAATFIRSVVPPCWTGSGSLFG